MRTTIENEVRNFYNELKLVDPIIRNPFIHRVHVGKWKKKIEIALGLFLLLPIRFLIALLLLMIVLILCFIATLGWNPPNTRTPLTSWRSKTSIGFLLNGFAFLFTLFSNPESIISNLRMRGVLPVLCRMILFSMGFHKIKVTGELAASSEAPVIVIAPHSSFLDVFVLCVIHSTPSGISKMENLRTPVLGRFFQIIEVIDVSRDEAKSRHNAIEELRYRSITTMGQWPHVCIFPEGTITNGRSLIYFKAGAFIPGCPVQPVCLRFPKQPDVYTWTWDGPGWFLLLMLLFCQLNNTAEVEFLPIWKPTEEERKDPKLYAKHVQSAMARHLDLPVTGHSYEDTVLMTEACQLGLPLETGIIEFKNTASRLGMSVDAVKGYLKRFAVLDSDKDGKLSLEDVALHYKLPITSPVRDLYSIFDRGNKRYINFRQYLLGSACLERIASKKCIAEGALKVLQEFSRPNQTLICGSDEVHILKNILQNIDDTFSDNYNVRSRNDEFEEFLSSHHEMTVLISSLLSPDEEKA